MASNWSQFNRPITISQAIANGTAMRVPSSGTSSSSRTSSNSLTSSLGNFPNTVQGSMDRANAANEARYGEAKGIYDTMLSNASGFGELENQRLNQSVTQQSTNLDQDLFSKGLGNTTIGPSMQAGIQREANFNRTAIADAVARQKNSILEGKAGVIERRQDLGPDLGLFSELQRLATGAPRSGGGSGGGYQPSVFGGSFTTPQRSSSSSSSSRTSSPIAAHQSQYQLSQQVQQQNAAATAQRQAADADYARRVREAQARQQQQIQQSQAQAAAIRQSSLYASGGDDYDYYDPDAAIYSSLSDGDYDTELYRQMYGYGY